MFKMTRKFLPVSFIILFVSLISCNVLFNVENSTQLNQTPEIFPDYTNIIIPPNIAPLNFKINKNAERYQVRIFVDSLQYIVLNSRKPVIQIPPKKWQKLLMENTGKPLYVKVYYYEKKWFEYYSIQNSIAHETIDPFIVYRYLRPNYTVQTEMQIRQRCVENFGEKVIMTSKTINGCINCHNFNSNDPSDMLFHIRWGKAAGAIMAQDGEVKKVDTRTEFNTSPGAYASWHPSGQWVAFSVNKVKQFFHAVGNNRDVIDFSSDLILFNTQTNAVSVDSSISSPYFMETFPNWSPDGRYLYFCRAPQLLANFNLDKDYRSIKYDLVRVSFDPERKLWGPVETLVSANETNQSSSIPKNSPDGKYNLFTMAEYGSFPIFHENSDLYLYDLTKNSFQPINGNSAVAEGYHSWSSNSRWFVFSSKRDNEIFTRLYFSYVDENGVTSKPFMLPQKNPEKYKIEFKAYSVPELIKSPIEYKVQDFIKTALDNNSMQKSHLQKGTTLQQTTEHPKGNISDYH